MSSSPSTAVRTSVWNPAATKVLFTCSHCWRASSRSKCSPGFMNGFLESMILKCSGSQKRTSAILGPIGPVEGAILDGFSNVFGSDLRGAFEIGDGAGDFQNTVMGAGAEPLLRH